MMDLAQLISDWVPTVLVVSIAIVLIGGYLNRDE